MIVIGDSNLAVGMMNVTYPCLGGLLLDQLRIHAEVPCLETPRRRVLLLFFIPIAVEIQPRQALCVRVRHQIFLLLCLLLTEDHFEGLDGVFANLIVLLVLGPLLLGDFGYFDDGIERNAILRAVPLQTLNLLHCLVLLPFAVRRLVAEVREPFLVELEKTLMQREPHVAHLVNTAHDRLAFQSRWVTLAPVACAGITDVHLDVLSPRLASGLGLRHRDVLGEVV